MPYLFGTGEEKPDLNRLLDGITFQSQSIFKVMAYVRKTEDEFQLLGMYGGEWELLTTETTRKEIKERWKEYRENEPSVSLKWQKKRVKIPTVQPEQPSRELLPVGCLVDSNRGIYGPVQVVLLAIDRGFDASPFTQEQVEGALDYFGAHRDILESEEWEFLPEEAETFLQDFVPAGFWAGWDDGNFGVWENEPDEYETDDKEETEPTEPFKVHGYYTISNGGGYEIELSPCGDMARTRENWGGENPKVSQWLPIEHVPNEYWDGTCADDEFHPVIDPENLAIPLGLVMRVPR